MAKYNLEDFKDVEKFKSYSASLIKKKAFIELKNINIRSLPQNAYLHVILGGFAVEFGYSIEYTKRYFYKEVVNKDIYFVDRKNAKDYTTYTHIRSSADLTKAEKSLTIDRFRTFSANNGLYLPDPQEYLQLREIEKEIEKNKEFL